MGDRHTSNLLNEADVFGLSGSGDGATVNNKTLMNTIGHGTHHPVDVCDIFDFTGYMEGGSINNPKFIRNCMKVIMDDIDTRKRLFNLINFDGYKVVQVAGESLDVYRPNLTCMLCTLNSGNTCFSDIGNMEFAKNIIRV